MSNQSATYQSRLPLTPDQEMFLSGYAGHYSFVERKLYADMQKTAKPAASFKNGYLLKYKLTARQFNAIGRNLEGKIASVLELLPSHKQELQSRIGKAKKVLKKLTGKIKVAKKAGTDCSKSAFAKHQKNRRLANLESRLGAIDLQIANKESRICFGSRALFQKQFHLEENGYADHDAWKNDWTEKRNSQFYVLGSKDETGGCQGCVITANLDGSFNLRLRSLSKEAEYSKIENIRFKYGADVVRQAIRSGQALSYRFLRDSKGWRVMVTTDMPETKQLSIKTSGSIGIDINANCLALAETDRFGNLVRSQVIPLETYGKSTDQAKAIIGDAVKIVIATATKALKPISVEKLNFSKKKSEMETVEPKQARMLSSFACNKIIQNIKTRAYASGIEVIEVNPAYTSTIGAVNYAVRYGISTHQAAALAIARRGLGLSEKPVKRPVVRVRNGGHVALLVPVRNPKRHLWLHWSAIRTKLSAVHVAHARSGDFKSSPAPLSQSSFAVALSPTWVLPARSRYANHRQQCPMNRQQHCSADVVGDVIPW